MAYQVWSMRFSMGLAGLALVLSGCGSASPAAGVDSDWARTPSELETTVVEITAGCQEAGGLHSECECIAEWLVHNTSIDEMAFGSEPPSTGSWIYLGGNLYMPGEYEGAFGRCVQ